MQHIQDFIEKQAKMMASGFNPDYTPQELEDMGVYDQVYGDAPSEASMEKWPESWIIGPDKKGWLEWYEQYYKGRRIPDVDRKQISRWKSFKARHGAQYKKNPTKRRKAALRNWAIDADKLLNEKTAGWEEFKEDRKADWKQLKYLARHKTDVYQSGRQYDVPRLQLLKHDWSKFKPSAWTAYREKFFKEGPMSEKEKQRFREQARKHKETEDHHVYKREDPTPISKTYPNNRLEMLADWHSVSHHGVGNTDKKLVPFKKWVNSQGYTKAIKDKALKDRDG